MIDATTQSSPAQFSPAESSPAQPRIDPYGWYTLAVLLAAYVFAFVDRHVINLLVEPIKIEFGLSDTQVSLVQGFAFGLFLSLAAFPIGRLIDTRRRTTILAGGVAGWSLATISCGLATSFPAFLTSRIAVSIGEATMTPTAMSLIGDRFPPRRMGLATAIYALGLHVGSGLALVLGAFAISHLSHVRLPLPWGGTLSGWHSVFVALGLPGILVAWWVSTLREPRRGAYGSGPQTPVPWREALAFLRANAGAMAIANLGVAFAAMASYGIAAWLPSFFIRTHGWTAADVGKVYGPIVIATGVAGVLIAGIVGDALVNRGRAAGRLTVMGCAALATIPFAVAAPLMPDARMSMALFALANLTVAAAIGSGPALLQGLAPAPMRGLTHAVALLTVNVLALGLGPTGVAAFTDYILHDEGRVGISLAMVPAIMLAVSATVALFGRPFLSRSLLRAQL